MGQQQGFRGGRGSPRRGESVRGAKRRVEEAGVQDIDVHGRYVPCVMSLLPNYAPLLTTRTILLLRLASLVADMVSEERDCRGGEGGGG